MKREYFDERVGEDFRALIRRGNITARELEKLRGNSWEWEATIPALDDEALISRTTHCLANCARYAHPCAVYDEAAIENYLPEVLGRFQRRVAEGRYQWATRVYGAVSIVAAAEFALREHSLTRGVLLGVAFGFGVSLALVLPKALWDSRLLQHWWERVQLRRAFRRLR